MVSVVLRYGFSSYLDADSGRDEFSTSLAIPKDVTNRHVSMNDVWMGVVKHCMLCMSVREFLADCFEFPFVVLCCHCF